MATRLPSSALRSTRLTTRLLSSYQQPLLFVPAITGSARVDVRGFHATRPVFKKKDENAPPPIQRTPLLKNDARNYDEVYNNFKFNVPEYFNIGHEICDKFFPKHEFAEAIIIHDDNAKNPKVYTYGDLHRLSNMFANVLNVKGVKQGDRIAVYLGQTPETVISHITAFKMGCISVPLFSLFGPEAIEYRLKACSASAIITDTAGLKKIMEVKANLPDLKLIVVTGKDVPAELPEGVHGYHDLLWKHAKKEWEVVKTKADDPAIIIFTSGTTGNPKGCVHAHRVLLGHLPGVEFPHNLFPQPGEQSYVFYTPADWSWIGGLLDVLLPALYHGAPVLAYKFPQKFDPKKVQELCRIHKVKHVFLPPTALKMMKQTEGLLRMPLRSVGSGGESLGDQILEWGKEQFGQTINEFYGQTEANLLVGNCSKVMRILPGSMGKAIPGHIVDIVNDKGEVLPTGEVGIIAVKKPDPVIFLQYWNNPTATAEKFRGDWLLTGDIGRKDANGYFWYVGRNDDLINTSGYRVGPSEVEHAIHKHKSVAMVAVIGVPDELRGEIIKAFVMLKEGFEGTEELKKEIQNFVKTRLAAHEYPRELEFVKELPLTATGKIMHKTLREQEKAKKQQTK
eukprot:Phypoly_transcript_03367.p1 GENE.Phypoly_transcript_03367~~Phypoly_transcript_03367.p1  ORF type:complete len:622 (+),score=98.47 Phypoly_transcript_03367:532-2397(+)